jgi:hypothetical protein
LAWIIDWTHTKEVGVGTKIDDRKPNPRRPRPNPNRRRPKRPMINLGRICFKTELVRSVRASLLNRPNTPNRPTFRARGPVSQSPLVYCRGLAAHLNQYCRSSTVDRSVPQIHIHIPTPILSLSPSLVPSPRPSPDVPYPRGLDPISQIATSPPPTTPFSLPLRASSCLP